MKKILKLSDFYLVLIVVFALFAGAALEHKIENSSLPEQACKARGGVWLADYYIAKQHPRDEKGAVIAAKVSTVYGCFDNPAKGDIARAFGSRSVINP